MSSLQRFGRQIVVVGLVAAGACQSDVLPAPVAHHTAAYSVTARTHRGRTLDDEYADLSADAPGFGGMFVDSSGVLNVYLTKPSSLQSARPFLSAFLSKHSHRGNAGKAHIDQLVARSRARAGRYDFRTLSAWLRSIVAPAVAALGTVTLTAVDHRNNRIVVGVAGAENREPVLRLLRSLPVPKSAVDVVVLGPLELTSAAAPDTALTSSFNPMPGGVQIARSSGAACSAGFNLRRWIDDYTTDTMPYLATASHCTETEGTVNGDYFGQPNDTYLGATEVIDPPLVTHDENADCPVGRNCFYSDAVLLRYSYGPFAQIGSLAFPAVNGTTVEGDRVTVDGIEDVLTGASVTKIGVTTGRTSGDVLYPCANAAYTSSSKYVWCVGVATYNSDLGDSGGPVVALHLGGASAVGIHFGRTYDSSIGGYISLYSSITGFFGQLWSSNAYVLDPTGGSSPPYTPPPPTPPSYWASVTGTSTAGPSMTCHFYGATNVDYPSYQWTVNGDVVGTNSDVYYGASSSFTLVLHAWNSDIGADAWTSFDVTVSEGTGQCYDQ